MPDRSHPTTPDGRYFLVAGRLWRATDPRLPAGGRQALVDELMAARRAVKEAKAGRGDLHTAAQRSMRPRSRSENEVRFGGRTARPT